MDYQKIEFCKIIDSLRVGSEGVFSNCLNFIDTDGAVNRLLRACDAQPLPKHCHQSNINVV